MKDEQRWTLGVDAETGMVSAISAEAVAHAAARFRGPGRALRDGESEEDLAEAGWGIVLPPEGGDEILGALEPLLTLRKEQAGDRYREYTYRLEENAAQFRQRLRSGFGPVDPTKIPYYLLLAGDIDQIPHGFQAGLDVPHAVGRICFPSLEGYRTYADRVVRYERESQAAPAKLAIFSPTHDGDAVTDLCIERCSEPLARLLSQGEGAPKVEPWLGQEATRANFEEILTDSSASVVFSIGHGTLYKSGNPFQRRLQGSLICADWSGSGPVDMDHIVASEWVSSKVRLDGRFFFLFGCFTGGTPFLDAFDPAPRDKRLRLAPKAFVASLPQTLLERGALAVIAHIERAFPDIFLWERYGQLDVFGDCLRRLAKGLPVGYAMERFSERLGDLAVSFAEDRLELGDPDMESRCLELWTAYNDTRGLIVLGDPAVRLV